jgi:hypothetical protein
MVDVIQVGGALLVLGAFFLVQSRRVSVEDMAYIAMNLGGSLLLLATAIAASQPGFVLINSVWAVISGWALRRRLSARGGRL